MVILCEVQPNVSMASYLE